MTQPPRRQLHGLAADDSTIYKAEMPVDDEATIRASTRASSVSDLSSRRESGASPALGFISPQSTGQTVGQPYQGHIRATVIDGVSQRGMSRRIYRLRSTKPTQLMSESKARKVHLHRSQDMCSEAGWFIGRVILWAQLYGSSSELGSGVWPPQAPLSNTTEVTWIRK